MPPLGLLLLHASQGGEQLDAIQTLGAAVALELVAELVAERIAAQVAIGEVAIHLVLEPAETQVPVGVEVGVRDGHEAARHVRQGVHAVVLEHRVLVHGLLLVVGVEQLDRLAVRLMDGDLEQVGRLAHAPQDGHGRVRKQAQLLLAIRLGVNKIAVVVVAATAAARAREPFLGKLVRLADGQDADGNAGEELLGVRSIDEALDDLVESGVAARHHDAVGLVQVDVLHVLARLARLLKTHQSYVQTGEVEQWRGILVVHVLAALFVGHRVEEDGDALDVRFGRQALPAVLERLVAVGLHEAGVAFALEQVEGAVGERRQAEQRLLPVRAQRLNQFGHFSSSFF